MLPYAQRWNNSNAFPKREANSRFEAYKKTLAIQWEELENKLRWGRVWGLLCDVCFTPKRGAAGKE